MATTINLDTLVLAVKFTDTNLGQIKLGTTALSSVTGVVLANDGSTVTIPNVGVLSISGGKVVFTADAALTGAVTLTDGTDASAKFITADFNKATGAIILSGAGEATAITGGAGSDDLSGAKATTFIGGAGNDTITAMLAANITGGTGADTFKQTNGANTLTVTDYNYSEGDAVKLAGTYAAGGAPALTAGGAFTSANPGLGASAVTVKDVAADGAYKIKVTDSAAGTAVTKEFWTVKTGTPSATLDASSLSGSTAVINAAAASSATVKGSAGDDTIVLAATGATLQVGVADGIDTVTFTEGFTGDVLNLTNTTLDKVTWGGTGGNTKIGGATGTQLDGVGNTGATGKILVQVGAGAVKKVAYDANGAGNLVTAATGLDADYYMAKGGTTKLNASAVTVDGTVVNLADATKYLNIFDVKGTAGTGTYIGTANTVTGGTAGTNFDLTSAATGKASEVWGGSSANDTVTLNSTNAAQDIVYFGTGDGDDSVEGFKTGFAATSDVVNFHNVSDVTKLSFVADGGTGLNISTTLNNKIDLALLGAATTAQLNLKNSAGVVKKVAVGYAGAAADNIDGVGADFVVGTKNGITVDDFVVYGATQTANAVVNLQDATMYKNIASVDMSLATGSSNVVVGSASVGSELKLATVSGAVNEAWGGSNLQDTFTLDANHQSKNTIWFGAIDGADIVTNFKSSLDKVKFHDKATVAQIASGYTFDGTNKFTSKTNSLNSLQVGGITANGTTTSTFLDANGSEVSAVLGGAALNYNKNSKLYMGANATLTVNGADNVVLYLGNSATSNVNDIYFSSVKTIDASAVTGQTVLIGATGQSNTLKAGWTTSAMWGGSAMADNMQGNSAGVDQYWFGAGDGADTVTNGVDKKDTIVLYGATSISDVTMTVNANDFVVTAKDGSTLTVTDATNTALDGGLTFQFGVNESAKSYTYNKVSKSFVAK